MVTIVLLNVALMWATPRLTLRRCLRFLLFATDANLPILSLTSPQRQQGIPLLALRAGKIGLPTHFLDALLAGHGLARSLASTGIGARPLTPHRQTATMPEAAVALNVFQPRDILLNLAAQRPLDRIFTVENRRQTSDVFITQILGTAQRINTRLLAQTQRQRRSNAVDVTQRYVRRFVVGQVNTQDTRHGESPRLALALFVSWIAANHEKLAVPAHELAILTDAFHTRPNLHRQLPTADIMPEMESVNIAIP